MTKQKCQSVSESYCAPQSEARGTPQESLRSPHRTVVVQFRVKIGTPPERFASRVEHIVSGRATRFHSPEELLAFFTTLLSTIQDSKEVTP